MNGQGPGDHIRICELTNCQQRQGTYRHDVIHFSALLVAEFFFLFVYVYIHF